MTKIKAWIFSTFLPSYMRESYVEDNARLKQRIGELEALVREERAYSRGLERALQGLRHITIQSEGVKHGID